MPVTLPLVGDAGFPSSLLASSKRRKTVLPWPSRSTCNAYPNSTAAGITATALSGCSWSFTRDCKGRGRGRGKGCTLLHRPKNFPFPVVAASPGERSVSVILLAGGKGKRMGATMPKQYLPLLGLPIALYSFHTFSQMREVKEIIVVCDPSYKDFFEDTKEKVQVDVKFALPGKERQDSVYSGLQAVNSGSELVCIHDSARPLVSRGDVEKVLKDGWENGAAVLGVPVKATIKEANSESFVERTLDRKRLWEMQTPQVIKPSLLKRGFELVNREGLEVTDDVSIVEHLRHPVYITEGSYTNIKVTTPDDLLLAERILSMKSGELAP